MSGGWGPKVIGGSGGGGPSIPGNTPTPDPAKDVYNEITGVLTGVQSTILSYVAPPQVGGKPIIHLLYANFGGTNISEYTMTINGTDVNKYRTYFGVGLEGCWDFRNPPGGKMIYPGDIVIITTRHQRPAAGDFHARLSYVEIN